ncbi:transposase [Actinacidiphila oryziradicis]|uniref:Transposase DDE domain-containing protein n=1 Tax=Actinacidiphila oryziradicis TaxID=2571141 RepID=A0A4U0SWU0_9ACTN|nr:transposase [Actinacidiphila oryziradicis]TKA01030.1 hypothetical protein FCI23_41220 [Actinacidiphila oryziradicis]TKA05005.1 hypothetical protein FCI23_33435 [Actinacidiphila oryziradicis]
MQAERHKVLTTGMNPAVAEGRTNRNWYPVRQHGRDAIVVNFARGDCHPCPARESCTASRRGTRMLTLQPANSTRP